MPTNRKNRFAVFDSDYESDESGDDSSMEESLCSMGETSSDEDDSSMEESLCSMGETSSDEDDYTDVADYLSPPLRATVEKYQCHLTVTRCDRTFPFCKVDTPCKACLLHLELGLATSLECYLNILVRETGDKKFFRLKQDIVAEAAYEVCCNDGDWGDFKDTCERTLKLNYGNVDEMETMLLLNHQFGKDVGNIIGAFLFWNHPHNEEYFEKRFWHGTHVRSEFRKYTRYQFKDITGMGSHWIWKKDEEQMKKLFFRRMNCCDYHFNDSLCRHCHLIDEEIEKRIDENELIESKKLLVQRSKGKLRDLRYSGYFRYRDQTNEYHESEMDTWVHCGLLTHCKDCSYCEEDPWSGREHKKWHEYEIHSRELEEIYRKVSHRYPYDRRYDLDPEKETEDDWY